MQCLLITKYCSGNDNHYLKNTDSIYVPILKVLERARYLVFDHYILLPRSFNMSLMETELIYNHTTR